jgi:hypothetical protein
MDFVVRLDTTKVAVGVAFNPQKFPAERAKAIVISCVRWNEVGCNHISRCISLSSCPPVEYWKLLQVLNLKK